MSSEGERRERPRGDGVERREGAGESATTLERREDRSPGRGGERIAAPFDGVQHQGDEREQQIQRLIDRFHFAGRTDARDADAHGTSGAAESLPHRERIQRSFRRHDVSRVGAHLDAAAAEGAAAMGARAFATGDRVAFAGAPDLHTAAHEAAHVVQQRGGVQLKGGVGQEGDAYERHADAVADRVVAGQSAEALLDEHAGQGGRNAAVQRAPASVVQRAPKDEPGGATAECEPQSQSLSLPPEQQAEQLRREQAEAARLPQAHAVDVSKLSKAGKLGEAIKRSGKHLGPEVAAKIEALVTPEALKMLALVLGGGVIVQAIPIVGEVADVALLSWAIYSLGQEALHACKELFAFVKSALAAGSEAALEEAGRHFANFVATVGVDAAVALLLHKAAKDVSGGVNRAAESLAESGPPGPTGLAPATAGGPSLLPAAANGYRVLADGTVIALTGGATGALLSMSNGNGQRGEPDHSRESEQAESAQPDREAEPTGDRRVDATGQMPAVEGAGPGGWNKGSYSSAAESLKAHFEKHGAAVGAKTVEQYLNKARGFVNNLRGAQRFPVQGATEGVVRYVKNGRYIDLAPDKSIISFGTR